MSILTKEEAKRILEKALSFSKSEACEISLSGNNSGNVRYARNTITTSGMQSNLTMAVQSSFGKKTGTATINELDDASLEKVVRRSEEIARFSPENPEFMGFLEPQEYEESKSFVQATADIKPEYRAKVAASSIDPAAKKNVTAAGFLDDSNSFSSLMNSKGLFAYNQNTNIDFTVTMRSEDGTGSGWVTRDFNDVTKFDAVEASQIAIEKCLQSRNPKAIEPGKYTVILEPVAAGDLIQNMLFNLNARTADEGRSFMSKKGGGTKLGEKIVDERINIYSDPFHPDIPSSTWNNDGLPRKKIMWIENGVVKNLFYDRFWADKKGVQPVPFPSNGIVGGGNASLEDYPFLVYTQR